MEDDFITIDINSNFYKKNIHFFGEDLLKKSWIAQLEGINEIRIKYSEYDKIIKRKEENEKFNFIINETARLNNLGIMLEKKGEIDTAISVYEENIKIGYPATHSYDRLMIIYHKLKQYKNEKRVIEIALRVFNEENKKRNDIAKKSYPNLTNELHNALILNIDFYNDNGICVFHPYKLNKWNNRLLKIINK